MLVNVNCYATSTRYRTTQHAIINGIEGKAYFINRPWETFYYQKAIIDALEKMHASKANINYIKNRCTSETQAKKYLSRYLRIA